MADNLLRVMMSNELYADTFSKRSFLPLHIFYSFVFLMSNFFEMLLRVYIKLNAHDIDIKVLLLRILLYSE